MFTPENITHLEPDQIFVYGSNLAGNNAGGAARYAEEHFGAMDGVGEGLTGQCYAFPTLNKDFTKRTLLQMAYSKVKLYQVADENPDKTFLVTKVGLGIAGFTLKDMQQVFTGPKPENVVLPKEFYESLPIT